MQFRLPADLQRPGSVFPPLSVSYKLQAPRLGPRPAAQRRDVKYHGADDAFEIVAAIG
jgi:hypothetical protein